MEEMVFTEEELALMAQQQKPSKGQKAWEIAKIFASGVVGGCAMYTAGLMMAPMVPAATTQVGAVAQKVGMFGLKGLVASKVSEDVHETLDSVEYVAKARIAAAKNKKARKLAERKKEKYAIVEED